MTLIGRNGSYKAISSPSVKSINPTNKVVNDNPVAATDKDVTELAHVADTFTTRTALNASRYSDEFATLALFPNGSPIIVTYYHQNVAELDIRTSPTDISPMAHPVHKDFTKIMNFEMRLLGPLESNFQTEDNSFDITGTAIVYPGFIPYIGDEFLLDIGDNKIGEFKINDVTPTSYRQGKYHRVSFEILNYVTPIILDRLDKGVRDVMYFDKNVYIGEGDYTFLTHSSYIQLQELKSRKTELLKYYKNKFYSSYMESFVRPDNIYDPYIVEYIRKKFSITEIGVRPNQLYTQLQDYHKTFWYILTDELTTDVQITNIDQLNKYYTTSFLQANSFATDLNALINKYYLSFDEEELENVYLFSINFYNINYDLMSPIERAMYNLVVNKTIDINSCINLLSTYRRMSDMDQFYQIPVLLELISYGIRSIT